MTLSSDVVKFQRFGGLCCLRLHLEDEGSRWKQHWPSETLASCNITIQCHSRKDHDLNLHRRENLMSRNL
jgi:hypothetical protein